MTLAVSATLSPLDADDESAEENPRTLPPNSSIAASKLNLVLDNELEFQIPYLYRVCNSTIVNCYRKAIKYRSTTISLNETIDNHSDRYNSKKSKFLEDFTVDTKANTESNFIVKTQVLEIIKKYSNNADALLSAVANKVIADKPAEIAQVIINAGSVEKALNYYIKDIQEMFMISYDELPTLPHVKSTGLSKLISKEKSAKVVSAKISNILNRTK